MPDDPMPTHAPAPVDAKPEGYTPPATQADLDRLVGERVARERAKYTDYADLKAKAEAHDAALEAAKTEQQRAVDAARKEGETAARESANARLVKAEAKAAAAALKFRNPVAAVRLADLSAVKVNDEGDVDETAVKVALQALATSDPYLLDDGKAPKPKPDRAQGAPTGTVEASVARGREMFANRRGAQKTTA